VDLPGVGDADPTRASVADRYLPQSKHVVVCAEATNRDSTSAAFHNTLQDIASELLRESRQGDVQQVQACTLVLTKVEQLTPYTLPPSDSDCDSDDDEDDSGAPAKATAAAAAAVAAVAEDSDDNCCCCLADGPAEQGDSPANNDGGAAEENEQGVDTSMTAAESQFGGQMSDIEDTLQLLEKAEAAPPDNILPLPDIPTATGAAAGSGVSPPVSIPQTWLDTVRARLSTEVSATKDAMQTALRAVYSGDPKVPHARWTQAVEDLHADYTSARTFLKHVGKLPHDLESCKLTKEETHVENLRARLHTISLQSSLLRASVLDLCNTLQKQHQLMILQHQHDTAAKQRSRACLEQLRANVLEDLKRLSEGINNMTPVIPLNVYERLPMLWTHLKWNTVECRLRDSRWLAAQLESVARPYLLENFLGRVEQHQQNVSFLFSAQITHLPREYRSTVLRHQGSLWTAAAVLLNQEVSSPAVGAFIAALVPSLTAMQQQACPFVYPAVRNGKGYRMNMINAVVDMTRSPAFRIVLQNAAAHYMAVLRRECEVYCTKWRNSTESLLEVARHVQPSEQRQQALVKLNTLKGELLKLAEVDSQEWSAWLASRTLPDTSAELQPQQQPQQLYNARHMYSFVFLNAQNVLGDGFYFLPWNWPEKHGLEPLTKLRDMKNTKTGMEIVVFDSAAKTDKNKTLEKLLIKVHERLLDKSAPQTAEDRALALAAMVDEACGGYDGRHSTEKTSACLRKWRAKHNTNVIDIGTLIDEIKLGVCRHRSMLFKFLADCTREARFHTTAPDKGIVLAHVYRGRFLSSKKDPNVDLGGGHLWNVVELNRPRVLDIMHKPGAFKDDPEGHMGYYTRGRGTKEGGHVAAGTSGLISSCLSWKHLDESQVQVDTKRPPLHRGKKFQVWHGILNGQQVAVKQPIVCTRDGLDRARNVLRREANILHLLRHGGQVPVLWGAINCGSGKAVRVPSIVMQFLDGFEQLDKRWVALCGLKPLMRLKLMTSIAEALSSLHPMRVVHGDMGPHNIMVSGEWQVRLVDFGLSSYFSSHSSKTRNTSIGVAPYAAPETSIGGAGISPAAPFATDIYGFGVMALESIRGVREPANAEATDLRARIDVLGLPSPTLTAILKKCLMTGVHSRPKSFDEVVPELHKAMAEIEKNDAQQ